MEFNGYIITIIMSGVLFFASVIMALYWASKKGMLRDFDAQAKCIFTEEEPIGKQIDFFPKKNKKRSKVAH